VSKRRTCPRSWVTLIGDRSLPGFQPVLLLSILLLPWLPVRSQVQRVDSGELTYRQPTDVTLEQFKGWVLEQARLTALANAFDTHVSSEFVSVDGESSYLTTSQVKGEWVETSDTEFEPILKDGEVWYRVRVVGKARPIADKSVVLEFEVTADVQGQRKIHHLAHDQRLRALFQSPVDGHLMLFYEEDDRVYELSNNGSLDAEPVEGQVAYTLFLKSEEWDRVDLGQWRLGWLDRYSYALHLTNKTAKESAGTVIAVFDRDAFAPPVTGLQNEDDSSTALAGMTSELFQGWIANLKKRRDTFQVEKRRVILLPESIR